ncbi:hypothetical protein GPALN_007759 [Globodera pallida]|nr:hypothetical protein GPALN_007759 [Globodera pallida]
MKVRMNGVNGSGPRESQLWRFLQQCSGPDELVREVDEDFSRFRPFRLGSEWVMRMSMKKSVKSSDGIFARTIKGGSGLPPVA